MYTGHSLVFSDHAASNRAGRQLESGEEDKQKEEEEVKLVFGCSTLFFLGAYGCICSH